MAEEIFEKYEFGKRSKFKKWLKGTILPVIALIVSIVSSIFIVITNNNTNDTLKEINRVSNDRAAELKKYEVTYKDRRDAYTDFNLTLGNFYKEMVTYCRMTDLSWPVPWKKEKIDEFEIQMKEVIKCMDQINEKTIRLYPYLNDSEIDSLNHYNYQLNIDMEKFLNYDMIVQGVGKPHTFRAFYYDKYLRFVNKLRNKFYSDSL